MVKNKVYYKNFITILSGNTISQLIPFIIAPILGRLFAPEEFAVFANFLAIVSMFGIVAAGRLELAIPIPKTHTSAQNVTFTGVVMTLLVTLLSGSVLIYSDELSVFYDNETLAAYLWYVPLAVFSIGILGLTNFWILRRGSYSLLSIGKISQSAINNCLAAVLGYIGWGINGLIIGWLVSTFAGVFIMLLFSKLTFKRRNYNLITVKTTLKEYRDFPLINSLHAFTDVFATQFLLFWIISSGFGLLQLGFFSIMHRYVRAPIALITGSVSQIFYKEASDAINNDKDVSPIFFRTLKTSGFFSIPFLVILIIWGPDIFSIYLGENWREAGVYAQRIIPILFFLFLSSPVSGITILFGKQKMAYVFAFVGYFVSLSTLYYCTLQNWDFKDGLLVYSISYSLMNLAALIWYYSIIKKHKNKLLYDQISVN